MEAQKRIKELETELSGYKQLTGMIKKDAEAKQEAYNNRLQSALQFEYEDFKSAEGLEMTADLGENMKLQLENIFNILAEAGIKMDV